MDRRGLYDDRAYWKQAIALKNQGYNIYYFVISYFEKADKGITKEGIHFQIIESKNYIENVLINYTYKKIFSAKNEFDEMFELVKEIQPDLVQFVDLRPLRLLDKIKKLKSSPKLIYDIREPRDNNLLDLRMKEWKMPFAIKKMYAHHIQNWEYKQAKKCDYLIAVDNGIENRIKNNVKSVPHATIYNFTNLRDTREHIPLENRTYDAAYFGGLSEIRGAKTIVEATKIIKDYKRNIKVLLLGNAHTPDLQKWLTNFIAENDLQNNLIWKKQVAFQEVSGYYNQVKIGLNPLHYAKAHVDIIQIKLFEYMNYGLPIITSNFGEMERYVIENQVGISIEPNNPRLLAESLLNFLRDKEKMDLYSKNGVRAVDSKFNWNVMEKKYIDIINQLLQS